MGYVHGNVCPESIRLDFDDPTRVILCDLYYARKVFCIKKKTPIPVLRTKLEGD